VNHKEIIRLSRLAYNDAKARDFRGNMKPYELWMIPFVLNLFAMAQEAEREACAKECEDYGRSEEMQAIGNDFANVIRARGQV